MTHESLARKLRVLRAARGITLAEAEELTGVTRETLGALERGQRGAYTSTLQKIADGYGTTVSALLAEEESIDLAGKDEAPRRSGQVAVSEAIEKLERLEGAVLAKRDEIADRLEVLRHGPFVDLERLCFDALAHYFFYETVLKEEFASVKGNPAVRDVFNVVRGHVELGFTPVVDDVVRAYRTLHDALPEDARTEAARITSLDTWRSRGAA